MLTERTGEFKIRGHHLATYGKLVHLQESMGSVGDDVDSIAIKILVSYMVAGIRSDDPEYKRDVLGNTAEDEQKYAGKLSSVFRQFLDLPDDTPIDLVVNQTDGMCSTCAIGEHCKEVIEVDGLYIQVLSDESNQHLPTSLGELKDILLIIDPDDFNLRASSI